MHKLKGVRFWCPILLSLSLVTYFVLAHRLIDYPGLNPDECLFIPAAVDEGHGSYYIFGRLFGLPTMSFAYIGALKSSLCAPVFALLGVNVDTIRTPAIVISMGTILMTFLLIRQWLPPVMSALAMFVLPSFVLETRADHGPVALMLLLKISAIYFFFRAIKEKNWLCYWSAQIALLLAVWDKQNNIWIVSAIGLSSVVYAKEIVALFRNSPTRFIASLVPFVGALAADYLLLIRPLVRARHQLVGPSQGRLQQSYRLWTGTFSGKLAYEFMLGRVAKLYCLCPPWFVGAVGACSVALTARQKPSDALTKDQVKAICFFGLFVISIVLQMAITADANWVHHEMVVWPLHWIVIFLSVALILKVMPSKLYRYGVIVAALYFVTVVAYQMRTSYQAVSDFRDAPNDSILWNHSIYQLSDYVKTNASKYDQIVIVDFGIGPQLTALAKNGTRFEYRDSWLAFSEKWDRPLAEAYEQDLFAQKKVLVVALAQPRRVFQKQYINFEAMVNDYHLTQTPLLTISDANGPLYEISEVKAP